MRSISVCVIPMPVSATVTKIFPSTSEDEQEILKMYQPRCRSYIVKPVDLDQFVRVLRSFSDY
jgi:DNA-binding NarL/FixJ family response regulator